MVQTFETKLATLVLLGFAHDNKDLGKKMATVCNALVLPNNITYNLMRRMRIAFSQSMALLGTSMICKVCKDT